MSRTNLKVQRPPVFTHEGARAPKQDSLALLKRSVMSCLLWESEFYEDGEDIANRIADLASKVSIPQVHKLAIEARTDGNLRHVPLWLAVAIAPRKGNELSKLLPVIIQRPDELTEFLSLYWKSGKKPLSAQIKKGLAAAFRKFNAYQLAKYNRKDAIRLRDVLFLCHAKPENKEMDNLWKALINDTLPVPDTWETRLSSGENKKEVFTDLITHNKLGALAFLRNLRNMTEAGISPQIISKGLSTLDVSRVLPFRFIAAERYAPAFSADLETLFLKSAEGTSRLPGTTVILVDVSGSMTDKLSSKSDLSRMDAACGVAMVAAEICERPLVFTFSRRIAQVPSRHGFGLRDAIVCSQPHCGTDLRKALRVLSTEAAFSIDRLIVITDEQSNSTVYAPPFPKAYIINVASAQNGIGFGPWVRINGFSESVVKYISRYEREDSR